MVNKQTYESLRFDLIWLDVNDIVTSSGMGGSNGDDEGTRLPPDFE